MGRVRRRAEDVGEGYRCTAWRERGGADALTGRQCNPYSISQN